jgi:methylated-DNA-protein-cysteine methyltransferase-like protein
VRGVRLSRGLGVGVLELATQPVRERVLRHEDQRAQRLQRLHEALSTLMANDAPFARVWALALRIPKGRGATYGQLSALIERRLTPVGIGWALRAAPPDVPWQRVVNARGGMSTDKHHAGLQRRLLEAEGVQFGADGFVDLARYGWKPRATR